MREIIFRISVFLFLVIFSYLLISFVEWNLNTDEWWINTRLDFIKYEYVHSIDYITTRWILIVFFIFSFILPPPIFKTWRAKKTEGELLNLIRSKK